MNILNKYLYRDSDTSYNIEDFLLEIEHLNTMINNRENQVQANSFKVRIENNNSINTK
jgi:hypothetical protein